MIDVNHAHISISRQCQLLDLPRATYYRELKGVSKYNLMLMDEIDKIYTKYPFYGSRKITMELHDMGYGINRKRVQKLMRQMGLEAIYPKPNLSRHNPEHKVYPYLLRNMVITKSDQVWSTDITYIRTPNGFMYLTAVMDWYSRFVLSWRLSNTLDSGFCLDALDEALSNGLPEIFNTDQGSQYTSEAFQARLFEKGIKSSMDGRGRALDNIFVERLWRSVKYEEVYLKEYSDVKSLKESLNKYFEFYNYQRKHQSLGYLTPAEVYFTNKKQEKNAA